jgi:hypothetical protein
MLHHCGKIPCNFYKEFSVIFKVEHHHKHKPGEEPYNDKQWVQNSSGPAQPADSFLQTVGLDGIGQYRKKQCHHDQEIDHKKDILKVDEKLHSRKRNHPAVYPRREDEHDQAYREPNVQPGR